RRPFEFKDAAILLRTRTHIRAVERALLEQQIPYVLSGGIGFYQTQEVYDFLNYFNFLLNPDDDVALTGILRSPFFVISDAELFEISLHRGQSFWLKLQAYAKDRDATPELRRALRVLKHHREIVHRLPIQLLVQRIFLQTGWRGTVTGLPSGGQNLANIQKLFRLAQEFEGKGFTTIYDFVRRLRTLAETEDREGQAASTIDGNYVKVMTIHAAKGLEFPVVFVPFAHQKFRYDRTPLLDPHLGIAYKVRDDDDFDRELTPSLFHLLQQRSNQKREAEEKRIFYVACTRARDAIILSGQWDVESSYPSFLRWTLDSLRLDVSTVRNGEHLFPESSLKVLGGSDGQLDVVQTRHRLRMSISFSEPAQLVFPQVQSESAGVFRPRRIFTDHLVGRSYGEVVSATQIKTFLECPTKYYLKYHLGVPERSSSPYDFDEEEESNDLILGEVEGLLTHALLQTIYDTSLAEEHIREKASQLVRTNSLGSYSPNESLVEAVAQNALGFINSSFGRTVLDASETRTELSLSAAYATDYLTGTIDRLYKDKSGCWCIVDYKTDKVKRAEIRKSAEIYKPQLLTYSILVKKLYRQNSVLATLVFLRHPSEPIHFNFNESDLERFETIVNQIIGNIKTYDFNRELDICESCSYRKANECLIPPSLTAPKRD
ncbi:MAG: PD-(D/E)XK nuclease family protein, partial [Ignavibacteriales bacterium]|nr:PD-(D/E)XK nuclease family protein [Ignavibacteriales bacterium]